MSRNRVANRAHRIYDFLLTNKGTGFTRADLLANLSIEEGSTTSAAIRMARDLATEAGYHFPPAVPANGHKYMVTDLAEHALDPVAHMGRIEAGVRARKEDGIEFMRRERQHVDPGLAPVIDMYITMYDTVRTSLAAIQKAADDMTVQLVKSRREARASHE